MISRSPSSSRLSLATASETSPVRRVEFGQSSGVDALRDATYFVAPFNASLGGPPRGCEGPRLPPVPPRPQQRGAGPASTARPPPLRDCRVGPPRAPAAVTEPATRVLIEPSGTLDDAVQA